MNSFCTSGKESHLACFTLKCVDFMWMFRLLVMQGNLLRGIDNYSGVAWSVVKTDSKWMFLINDRFTTISGHFFPICMFIFHKTKVQMVILRCLTCLYLNWFKSYDTKLQKQKTPKIQNWQNWWIHAKIFSSIYKHFYEYPNENWDSDCHFKMLNGCKF